MDVADGDPAALGEAGHDQLAVERLAQLGGQRVAHCPGLGRVVAAQGRVAADADDEAAASLPRGLGQGAGGLLGAGDRLVLREGAAVG